MIGVEDVTVEEVKEKTGNLYKPYAVYQKIFPEGKRTAVFRLEYGGLR